jgi:hypothetical protein
LTQNKTATLVSVLLAGFLVACSLAACSDDTPGGGGSDDGNNTSDMGGTDDSGQIEDTGRPDTASDTGADADPDTPGPDTDDVNPPECEADHARCLNERTLETCEDGVLVEIPCEVGQICSGDECLSVVCRPGETLSCASNTALIICDETGTGQTELPCEEGLFCDFVEGEYACTNQICTPGETRCAGLLGNEVCAEDGTQWTPGDPCPSGEQCDNGECRTLCEINSKVSSFLGCEYWSADLDNITGGLNAAHAVIVSNPHPDIAAEITVTSGTGSPVFVDGWPTAVAPGELAIWRFENTAVNSLNNEDLLDTTYVDGTIVGDQTFKFESSIPVTAHQFNPLVENNVFTNDASLLLPTNAIGTEYLVMSWKHRGGINLRGFAAVIAVGTEPTEVQVTPTTAVVAGRDRVTDTPIPRIAAGETRTFTLMPGQILNLETEGPAGADLTGTEIITNQPAVVFGGHECANVPLGFDACDHLEQQLFPVDAWGSSYAGTYFHRRGERQVEVWRILSGADGVLLSTNPPIPNVDGTTLNRGEFLEFESSTDFELTADGPILPAQYIVGTRYRNLLDGDPAFTLLVPVEQWRRDYIVLTPPAYHVDYLNVVAPAGTTVLLDGAPIDPATFTSFATNRYAVARIAVPDGPHTLSSTERFGVIAYGYDSAVSYAYPGGLNLEDISD